MTADGGAGIGLGILPELRLLARSVGELVHDEVRLCVTEQKYAVRHDEPKATLPGRRIYRGGVAEAVRCNLRSKVSPAILN